MRTLDQDIASSHRPLPSHPTRLQLSTASLPRPVPPHSLASSPITALAGTEPGTRGPGITGGGSARCHAWPTDLHQPLLGLHRARPTLLHSPGQAALSPRSAEGVTRTHAWKATSRGSVSQQTWPLWTAQQAATPTIREALQDDAHFLALDLAKLCSHPGSFFQWPCDLGKTQVPPEPVKP